jgi:hypothetical protein
VLRFQPGQLIVFLRVIERLRRLLLLFERNRPATPCGVRDATRS